MPTHHGISYDDLRRRGVDEDNRLYWNGRSVVIKVRLALARRTL